jgi:hypothetical protein
MYRPFSLCEKQYSCIHHLFLQSWWMLQPHRCYNIWCSCC